MASSSCKDFWLPLTSLPPVNLLQGRANFTLEEWSIFKWDRKISRQSNFPCSLVPDLYENSSENISSEYRPAICKNDLKGKAHKIINTPKLKVLTKEAFWGRSDKN